MRVSTRWAILAAVSVLAVGCGDGGDRGDDTGAADSGADVTATTQAESATGTDSGERAETVTIENFQYAPKRLEVAAGTTVRWTNQDDAEHTATAGSGGNASGEFDITLDGGGSGEHTFSTAGTFAYFCQRHPGMTAEIVVA